MSKETKPKVIFVPTRIDASNKNEAGCHGIPRLWPEDRFHAMLERIGCDTYGHFVKEDSPLAQFEKKFEKGDPEARIELDTPLFTIRPYYWGYNRSLMLLPNFVYKPWSFEIHWYKWPMRGAESNFVLKDDDWSLMCSTIERAVEQFEQTKTWPEDIDDFPRMPEIDEIAYELRKETARAWSRANEFEDLLYEIFVYKKTTDDVRKKIATAIGIADDQWTDHLEDEDTVQSATTQNENSSF